MEEERHRCEEAWERVLEIARERFREAYRADVLGHEIELRFAERIRPYCRDLRQRIEDVRRRQRQQPGSSGRGLR